MRPALSIRHQCVHVSGAILWCAALLIPAAANAQTPPSGNWSVVTVAKQDDGFVRFGDGTGQWLDRRCVTSLRAAKVPVATVRQSQLEALKQIFGIASCERIASLLGAANDRPWTVVTTSGKGDGFVLFGDNTRQWLDVPCVARLRKAGLTVKLVPWDAVKGMSQIPGVGDCDKVQSRTVKSQR